MVSFVTYHLFQIKFLCQYISVRLENEKKMTVDTILRSSICQLANSCTGYERRLWQLDIASTDITGQDHRWLWHLLYNQFLLPLGTINPIYWITDGLDEANAPQFLLNLLAEFGSNMILIRDLILSSHARNIATSSQNLAGLHQMWSIYVHALRDAF